MSISPIPSFAFSPVMGLAPAQPALGTIQPPSKTVQPTADVSRTSVGTERDSLEQALDVLTQGVRAWSTHLQFEIDEDSGRTIVRVIDTDSGDVVRQIPSDEVLNLARQGGTVRDLAFRSQG